MDNHTEIVIAGLLLHNFGQSVQWDFNALSSIEQHIVGNQENLDKLKNFTLKKFNETISQ